MKSLILFRVDFEWYTDMVAFLSLQLVFSENALKVHIDTMLCGGTVNACTLTSL